MIDKLIIILGTADFAITLPSLVSGGNLFGMTRTAWINQREANARLRGSELPEYIIIWSAIIKKATIKYP